MSPIKKPAASEPTADAPTPVVRRISNPRPKRKPAADAPPSPPAAETASPYQPGEDQLPAAVVSAPPASPAPEPPPGLPPETPATAGDWPEPEAPTTGGSATPDGKRKRRRRKGKGQSAHAQATPAPAEETQDSDDAADSPAAPPTATAALRPPHAPHQQPPRQQQQQPRKHIDPETLARRAWKIYLAEVSEEGVALIGDQDARELARRCFRLAEIFIEEQARRGSGGL